MVRLVYFLIRRAILSIVVLTGISLIVFYLGRAFLSPSVAVTPYITPRMNNVAKLAQAQSVGVATLGCPSWTAFVQRSSACIVPVYDQYLTWARMVFSGNWGYSLIPGIAGGQTTWNVFWLRFPVTAELAIVGGLLTVVIALPLGIISASHRNKLADHASRLIALSGYSMPIFWLGYVLQIIFVLYLKIHGSGILPAEGILPTNCGLCIRNPGAVTSYTGAGLVDSLASGNLPYFWDSVIGLVLPAITLSFGSLGLLARIVRSSMVDALKQDYILLARSKGLKERTVIYRHALKNAILPTITVMGLLFAFLFGGVIIIEDIFSLPGVGQASLQATYVFDINFLELYTLVTAIIIVVANLTVDVIYSIVDPRIRL